VLSILKSIILICTISSLGAAASHVYGYSATYTFIILILVQFVIGYAVNTAATSYILIRSRALEIARIESFSKQSADLKCAFCGDVSIVPIRMDTDNEYRCPNCNERNSVYLNITVARSTTPMNMNKFTTSMIDDDKERVINEMQVNG